MRVSKVVYDMPIFMEVNPNVASKVPDNADVFSFKDQQAAQPQPGKGSNAPHIESDEINTQKIVDGDARPTLVVPVEGVVVEMSQGESVEGLPYERAISGEGVGVAMEAGEPREDLVLFGKKPRVVENAESVTIPKPRPRIQRTPVEGPLRKIPTAASELGEVAINAKLNEFGIYTQKMIESIAYQWRLLGARHVFSPRDIGSIVVVEFVLNKEGGVNSIQIQSTTASDSATFLCKDAILSLVPFGEWSPEMIAFLGENERVSFSFHYR
ncbi:MAG TPA: hypothetical protein DHV51_01090 [Opitutae bacterium]|nr:hypothetical protein [Opitutae bacterium]